MPKAGQDVLIEKIAAKSGVTKAKAKEQLDAVLEAISTTLVDAGAGGSVGVVGFGTFKNATAAARSGTNPATGAPYNTPARQVARFKPGKSLLDALNAAA